MNVETVRREVPVVHPGAVRIVVWVALGGTSWAAVIGAVVAAFRLIG